MIIRKTITSLAKFAIHYGGISSLARTALAGRGVILRYHSVSTEEDGTHLCLDPGLAVTPTDFDRQCTYLKKHYRVISLDEMVENLSKNRPQPPKAVALTFDDGYLDNYTRAFPILKSHGMNATFYVTTNCIDNEELFWVGLLRFVIFNTKVPVLETTDPMAFRLPLGDPLRRKEAFTKLVVTMKNISTNRRLALLEAVRVAGDVDDLSPLANVMMTWDQVREMYRAGMIFGAHTLTHPNLPNATFEEAELEIAGSKTALERELQSGVRHFSYPNGRGSSHLTETVKGIVRDAGFASSTTSITGGVQAGDDALALKRIGIYKRHGSMPEFTLDIERGKLEA